MHIGIHTKLTNKARYTHTQAYTYTHTRYEIE